MRATREPCPTARRLVGWGCLAVLLIALLGAVASSPAEARTRVFVGVGLGFGYYYPPPYYYYPYYYPPPAYYYPPPAYYYPPPTYYAPPATNCQTFQGNATNDQTGQPFYGTACLGPDGRWHIAG